MCWCLIRGETLLSDVLVSDQGREVTVCGVLVFDQEREVTVCDVLVSVKGRDVTVCDVLVSPIIWHTYMKLVTKYQIPVINSCSEKCDEKCAYTNVC